MPSRSESCWSRPREYADVVTALIDLDPERGAASDIASTVDEIEAASGVIALRGATRLAPAASPAVELTDADEVGFRHHGTYLITGGLGGVGEVLATHLATTYSANLVIVSTEPVPAGIDREVFLRHHAVRPSDVPPDPSGRQPRAARRQGARRPGRPQRCRADSAPRSMPPSGRSVDSTARSTPPAGCATA